MLWLQPFLKWSLRPFQSFLPLQRFWCNKRRHVVSSTRHFDKWHFINATLCQADVLSTWCLINMLFCSRAVFIILFYEIAILTTWNFINFWFHQLAISSTYHFINLSFHQLVISSTWHIINLPFHQLAISSTCHFINLPFRQLAIS